MYRFFLDCGLGRNPNLLIVRKRDFISSIVEFEEFDVKEKAKIKKLTHPTNDLSKEAFEYKIIPQKDITSVLQPDSKEERIKLECLQSYFLNFDTVEHADPEAEKMCKEQLENVIDGHLKTIMDEVDQIPESYSNIAELNTNAPDFECALQPLWEIRRILLMQFSKCSDDNETMDRYLRIKMILNSECLHRPICLLYKKEIYVGPVRNGNNAFPTF